MYSRLLLSLAIAFFTPIALSAGEQCELLSTDLVLPLSSDDMLFVYGQEQSTCVISWSIERQALFCNGSQIFPSPPRSSSKRADDLPAVVLKAPYAQRLLDAHVDSALVAEQFNERFLQFVNTCGAVMAGAHVNASNQKRLLGSIDSVRTCALYRDIIDTVFYKNDSLHILARGIPVPVVVEPSVHAAAPERSVIEAACNWAVTISTFFSIRPAGVLHLLIIGNGGWEFFIGKDAQDALAQLHEARTGAIGSGPVSKLLLLDFMPGSDGGLK